MQSAVGSDHAPALIRLVGQRGDTCDQWSL